MATSEIEAKRAVAELGSNIQRTAYDGVAEEHVERAQMFVSAVGFVLAAAEHGLLPDQSHMQHLAGLPSEEWPDADAIVKFLHDQARTEMNIARDVEDTQSFIG